MARYVVKRSSKKILSYSFDGINQYWYVNDICFFGDKHKAYKFYCGD